MLSGSALSSSTPNKVFPSRRVLLALGSPRWMLAFFAFAFIAAQVAIHRPDWLTAAWTLPLTLFAVCLLAAIATSPRFRADAPLLVLHLGLLALVALIAISRLSYLDAAVTLTQGIAFDGKLLHDQRGPLHGDEVHKLRFMHEGVEEAFHPGASRPAIYNQVRWWDSAGRSHVTAVADNKPLEIGGYRIFATHNRGYAPVFSWRAQGAPPEVGTIQLGAGESFTASNTWTLADGTQVWLMLDAPKLKRLQPGERRRDFASAELDHRILLRAGESRFELRPGDTITLGGGELSYIGLKTWMGYRIVHDVATHWLLAAIGVALGGMIWFYARRLRARDADDA